MPAENDDAFDADEAASQWQFGEWRASTPAQGGGLLQTILDEVTAIREGAAADRVALAKAISASFSKMDAELADVRSQLHTVRSEIDDLRSAISSSASVDVRPQVSEVLSSHVAAVEKQLDALRDAIPSDHLARVASQVAELRLLLVGPA